MSAATIAARALRPMRTSGFKLPVTSCPRRVTAASYFPRETTRSFSKTSLCTYIFTV